eukprot:2312457-Rhodomonas_salina.1
METNCLDEGETSCKPELFLLQAPWIDLQLVSVLSSLQRLESVARAAARAVPRLHRHDARGCGLEKNCTGGGLFATS